MCYQFASGEWLCLGDVTGAAGGSQQQSGKKLHEGKEYDYVFSVDISDTGLPLKLPYNCSDDPWIVAQKFIHAHELPQAYLEQVANFIIKNSEQKNPSTQTAQTTASAFADPFTGAGRYIPGSGSNGGGGGGGGMQHSGANDYVDPFTGASSYRTAAAREESTANNRQPTSVASSNRKVERHFPHSVYTIFAACDPAKVLDKIRYGWVAL